MGYKKIAVLGSNSFSGSHFVNYVLENTDADIIGISRSAEYDPLFLPYLYKKERQKRFTFHQLDVNKDLEDIIELFDREKPEAVVNYAAQGEVRNSWKWPEKWFQTNCLAVVNLTNQLKEKDYLEKYVAISTPEVYGSTEERIKENNNFSPSTPYATSKLAGDLFLMALFKKYDFPVVFTRSANVYGIHQQLYRIIPKTIISLNMGRKIELHGGGRARRSFVHVGDIADATWKAIEKGDIGEVYHLSSDDNFAIRDVVRKVCDIMGSSFDEFVNLVDENYGQDAIYSLDYSKAQKELGWQPKTSFREGVEETIEWINKNFEEIKKQELEYSFKE